MQNLLETLTRIGPGRLIAVGLTLIGLVAFMGFFVDRMTKPEMSVLFADLEAADAGAVVSRLETMGVPVEISAGGGAVMAPKGDIARLRMILAQDGLPAGGGGGYELLDQTDGLGATNFAQQMNRLRAMEGELARSIRTLGPVRHARVHLVLPKRELFSREQQEPSASIVVSVRGAALNPGQVAAIRHLVAAAVPKLQPSRVSIVDTAGNLLASGEGETLGGAATAAIDAQARRAEVEERLARAIESLLERAIGPGRVRAEVSAELDFDRITTNSEQFDPEGQVLRSSQVVTEENQSSESATEGGAVTVDRNLPEAELANPESESGSQSSRTEEISNFEISKTVRTHIRESGLVRRMSVAVMVDAQAAKNAEGEITYQARTPEELATLEALAKSAVGFDADRGDVFQIASLEFARPEEIFGDPDADALKLDKEDYFRIGQLAALFIVALLAVLFVMRPAVNRTIAAFSPDPEPAALPPGSIDPATGAMIGEDGQPMALAAPERERRREEEEDDSNQVDLESIRAGVSETTVTQVGVLIDEYPEESVAVIRSWMQDR